MTAWLLDTGPLVAFFDRSDAVHEWAKQQWTQAPVPMLTCEAVLAEAAYLLREHAGLPGERILALFERKVITVPFSLGRMPVPWRICWRNTTTRGCNWRMPAWCACPS